MNKKKNSTQMTQMVMNVGDFFVSIKPFILHHFCPVNFKQRAIKNSAPIKNLVRSKMPQPGNLRLLIPIIL